MVVLSSMITEAKEGRHRGAHNAVFEAESVKVDYRDSTGESGIYYKDEIFNIEYEYAILARVPGTFEVGPRQS